MAGPHPSSSLLTYNQSCTRAHSHTHTHNTYTLATVIKRQFSEYLRNLLPTSTHSRRKQIEVDNYHFHFLAASDAWFVGFPVTETNWKWCKQKIITYDSSFSLNSTRRASMEISLNDREDYVSIWKGESSSITTPWHLEGLLNSSVVALKKSNHTLKELLTLDNNLIWNYAGEAK